MTMNLPDLFKAALMGAYESNSLTQFVLAIRPDDKNITKQVRVIVVPEQMDHTFLKDQKPVGPTQ